MAERVTPSMHACVAPHLGPRGSSLEELQRDVQNDQAVLCCTCADIETQEEVTNQTPVVVSLEKCRSPLSHRSRAVASMY